tara:strand:+ start:8831 stop:10051 length:1221 start_codon:yes stop_codon:yes gene_type:complete
MRIGLPTLWLFILLSFSASAQRPNNEQQQKLEAQKLRLQKEIKQINQLLFKNRKQKKSVLSEVEDIDVKLQLREELIKVNNQQANVINRRVRINEKEIADQRKELENLKKDYARMILESYESKSLQSRLLFLFSSESFLQAFKRIQYLKQYAIFRRKQGLSIAKKTQLLQELNKTLLEQKDKLEAIVSENKKEQEILLNDQQQQQRLIKSLRRTERNLAAQINKKQAQAKAIDKEIDRLIREAIAAANKTAGSKNRSSFELTPEAKLIAANFESNKGRLPWPLEEGVVVQGFGRHAHPVVKTTIVQSNGVTIATKANAPVRSVFEGEVMSIVTFKGSNPFVLIRHGNYITAYKDLGKVYVKKGDKVLAKQEIGAVFTNPQTGKSQLQFSIFKNNAPQNPKSWVYRM